MVGVATSWQLLPRGSDSWGGGAIQVEHFNNEIRREMKMFRYTLPNMAVPSCKGYNWFQLVRNGGTKEFNMSDQFR